MSMNSVLLGMSTSAPSLSVTSYRRLASTASDVWHTAETNDPVPVPVAFDLSNFYVELTTAPSVGKSWVFTVRKNNADTALTVTISDTATSASDLSHTVSFAVGDTINISATPTGTPTTPGLMFFNALANTTSVNAQPILGRAASSSTSSTLYFNLYGGTAGSSIIDASTVVSAPGTIDKLYILHDAAPGSGKNYVYTLFVNGSATSLTATLADLNTSVNDTTHSVSVSAGDLISLECAPNGTPTASFARYSTVFTPTNYGDTIMGMVSGTNGLTLSGTQFDDVYAVMPNYNNTESNVWQVLGAYLLRKFYVDLKTAPGVGNSIAFTLEKASVDTGLSVTISGANTTGNVTSDVTYTQGSKISLKLVPTGTPSTPVALRFGYLLAFTTTSTSSTSSSISSSTSSTSSSISTSTSSTSSSTSRSTSTSSTSVSSTSSSISTTVSFTTSTSSTSLSISISTSTSSSISTSSTSSSISISVSSSTSSTSTSLSTSTTLLDISIPSGYIRHTVDPRVRSNQSNAPSGR